MRRALMAANWKLHKTLAEAQQFVTELHHKYPEPGLCDVVIAAPFTALAPLRTCLQDTPYHLAAQDVFWETHGAYTGEISAPMLVDAGCTYVIIGHSERRQLFGETDDTVCQKVATALQAGLRPIVCIGESLAQRQAGETLAVLTRQVQAGLASCQSATIAQIALAYEPLWAIGTGVTATPAQAQEVHHAVRSVLRQHWGADAAEAVRIQYGGSVRPENVAALMAELDIDGALVGGASLEVDSFVQILTHGRR